MVEHQPAGAALAHSACGAGRGAGRCQWRADGTKIQRGRQGAGRQARAEKQVATQVGSGQQTAHQQQVAGGQCCAAACAACCPPGSASLKSAMPSHLRSHSYSSSRRRLPPLSWCSSEQSRGRGRLDLRPGKGGRARGGRGAGGPAGQQRAQDKECNVRRPIRGAGERAQPCLWAEKAPSPVFPAARPPPSQARAQASSLDAVHVGMPHVQRLQ